MLKQKICILTSVHSVFDGRIFHKEAETLVNAGYDLVLIAQHNKEEVVDGVRIVPLPKPQSRIERFFKLDYLAYKKAIEQRADICHFHDPELLPWMIILKIKTKAKVIYDVHEDYAKQTLSKEYIPKLLRKTVAYALKLIENICSRYFDAFVTATDNILKNFSYHKRAISVKNYPIKACFKDMGKNNIKDKESNIFNIIYVGGLTAVRGITQIIQSLEHVNPENNIKLTLCGKFNPSDYELKVRELKGFEKVDYLGYISLEKIPVLMSKANVGMVCFLPEPNHINAMPNKLFEYMAAGLPVIASNFSLWKEIIAGNNCGICVNPLEPKEIARAVEHLMANPEEAKKMGENGRKAVLEKYNWENEAKKLKVLYRKILE
jgi:glycosyltransferase involved in cell wall biosynthesis